MMTTRPRAPKSGENEAVKVYESTLASVAKESSERAARIRGRAARIKSRVSERPRKRSEPGDT